MALACGQQRQSDWNFNGWLSFDKNGWFDWKNPYQALWFGKTSQTNSHLPWLKIHHFVGVDFGFCRYPKGFYKAVILEDSGAPQRLPREVMTDHANRSPNITQPRDGCFRFGETKIFSQRLQAANDKFLPCFFSDKEITLTKQTEVAQILWG